MASGFTLQAPARESFAFRVALLLNGGLFLIFLAFWLKMAVLGVFWRADFTGHYTGWAMVLDGQSAHLYDLEWQAVYQQRLLPDPGLYEGLLPFPSPPHSVLLLAPLALLPRGAAFYFWALFQLALCVQVWRFIVELMSHCESRTRWILLVCLLGFPPLFLSFQHGQMTLLLLVCLLGFVRGMKQQRPWQTALWLILGTVKPQLMVLPTVVLLASRQWRTLAIATVVFSLWTALSVAVLGWECLLAYPQYLQFSARQFGTFGIDPLCMYNLKGLFTALLGSEQGVLINGLTTAALFINILAVLWLWRKSVRSDSPNFDLRMAFTLLLGLICNPHLNPPDVLILVLPAVLFLGWLQRRSLPLTAPGAIMIGCPLLFFIDVYAVHSWPGHIRPFFLFMLAATGWVGWRLLSQGIPSRRPACYPPFIHPAWPD